MIVCEFHYELYIPPTSEVHKHAITSQGYHSTPQQCRIPRAVFTVDPVHADHAVLDLSCNIRSRSHALFGYFELRASQLLPVYVLSTPTTTRSKITTVKLRGTHKGKVQITPTLFMECRHGLHAVFMCASCILSLNACRYTLQPCRPTLSSPHRCARA